MELSHLRYVVKVAETSNFSKAAEQLFITQPTLSQQISALEDELGLKLFKRTTRKVSLTPEGEEFVRHARTVLGDMDELIQSMDRQKRMMKNTLSIGLLSALSHLNLPEVIQGFQQHYPNIKIKLQIAWSSDLIERVLAGELDAAIASFYFPKGVIPDSRLNIQIFLEDVVMVVCSRQSPIHNREYVTLEELCDFPIVGLGDQTIIQSLIVDIFSQLPNPPQVICTCPNMDSLLSMVQANVGITFLSSGIAHAHLGNDLVTVPLRPAYHTQTAFVTNWQRESSYALRLFEDYLRGAVH